MPYAASFPGCKIDHFLRNFYRFFGVCRLGYLKPPHSKASKSELFTNYSPSPGTETIGCREYHHLQSPSPLQTIPLHRGWKRLISSFLILFLALLYKRFPLSGMKTRTFLSEVLVHLYRLSKLFPSPLTEY